MSDTLPFHFRVFLVCKDCGQQLEVSDPNPTKELVDLEQRTRWCLLQGLPNECPKCHNLRIVASPPPDGEVHGGN